MESKALIITTIVCIAIIGFPLAIANIVLGAIAPGSCDYKDIMGLDVAQYLLGLGIASLIICVLMILFSSMSLCKSTLPVGSIGMAVISILNAIFGTAWFIVGAIILFRSNIDCIHNTSAHVIYALVLWCISAVQIIQSCCTSKPSTNSNA
jgi:hypothetical protein